MRHGLVINTMEDVNGKKSYMKKTLVDHYVLIKDLNKFMYNETKDGISVCTVCWIPLLKICWTSIKQTVSQ